MDVLIIRAIVFKVCMRFFGSSHTHGPFGFHFSLVKDRSTEDTGSRFLEPHGTL